MIARSAWSKWSSLYAASISRAVKRKLQLVPLPARSFPADRRELPLIHARMLSIIALPTTQVAPGQPHAVWGFAQLLSKVVMRCMLGCDRLRLSRWRWKLPAAPTVVGGLCETDCGPDRDESAATSSFSISPARCRWPASPGRRCITWSGLEQLGYRAWYVEDGGANPFDPRANSVAMECDYNVRYLQQRHGDAWIW